MVEAEPPVINNEFADQKPFVIRAHHLRNYASLINDDLLSPEILAMGERGSLELEVEFYITRMAELDGQLREEALKKIMYCLDVIGNSPESADRHEERIRAVYEKFVSLPDDYPAELTEEVPDAICETCALGIHCRTGTFVSRLSGDDPRIKESQYLDEFLQIIKRLNLPKPVISYEIARFPNANPEQVRRIKTTLGTVKKVLKEGKSELWAIK